MKRISLVSDTIDRGDIDALIGWLQQTPIPRLTKGDLTRELEARWADMVGTKYSVFVNSGSSAILLLLASYKEYLGGSLRIVVPALSWATDVSSPMLLGYDIKLCDCNFTDLSCERNELQNIFEQYDPDIFLSVSPLGLIPDMDSIRKLCDKHRVILIEDNCESMGSHIGGKMLGSYGEASVFSMYYGHHLSTIEGGFINTSDDVLYNMLLSMRSHGWDREWDEKIRKEKREIYGIDDFNALYTFYLPGFNVRATDLQAFIGLRQLDKLERYAKRRNYNFHYYKHNIKKNILALRERGFISNFAYPVAISQREDIVKELQEKGVEVRPIIAGSMGKQPFWIRKHGNKRYANAELIHEFGFYLPNHPDLKEEEMDYIIDIINKY